MAKNVKQLSDEMFNADKESEVMKRLTLPRIASALFWCLAFAAVCTHGHKVTHIFIF